MGKRRLGSHVLSTIAAVAAIALAVPAAAQSIGDRNENLKGKLNWASMGSQEKVSRLVNDAYKAVRPNVDVEYNAIPGTASDLRTGLLARQLANNMPDVFQIADRFPRQFGEAGLSADLTPFLDAEGSIGRGYFAPTFLKQYEIQDGDLKGTIQGLPQTADVVVLYYNTRHFDAAGLAYPNENWTWDDLVKAARALTVQSNGQTTRYGFGTRYAWHASYVPTIQAFGGKFMTDEGKVDLTSPASLKAFHNYYDYVKEGIFAPPAALRSQGDEATAFGNDFISMFAFPRAALPRIRAVKTDGFDVALLPKINGVRASGMGSVGMTASPQGMENNREIVYDFLNWYFSPDGGMKVLTANYAVVPPSTALFDSPIWRKLPGAPRNTDPYVQAMAFGVQNPANIPADAQSTIDEAIRYAEDQIMVANVPIEDALAEAEQTINEALAQYN